MTFNFLDIIFIALILVCAIQAAVNGFIKEFFGKAAFVLGIFVAVMFYAKLMPYVNRYIKSALVYLIVRLVQQLVGSFFSGDILSGLDRALGFFFGVAEGLLLISVVLVVLYAQPWFGIGPLVKGSFFHKMLENLLVKPVSRVQDLIACIYAAGERFRV